MNKVSSGLSYVSSLKPWSGRGDFTLDGVRSVLRRLGDPQDSRPTVHVGGTNGKGSVAVSISAILGATGSRVGLNISPHLTRVHERVVIDGVSIQSEPLGELAYDVMVAAQRGGVELSMHEAMTIIAFLSFRELDVEWGVVEVGLGGRLDASNVIRRPEVSVIVTVDFDHQEILGDTIVQIATEKAGIVKSGAPVLAGRMPLQAREVIQQVADRLGSRCSVQGREFKVTPVRDSSSGQVGGELFLSMADSEPEQIRYSPGLPGQHQIDNMGLSIVAGRVLGIAPATCSKAVSSVFWPARLEKLRFNDKDIILDCAHNAAGVRSLISFLDSEGIERVDLAFGVLSSKNWKEMVAILAPRVAIWRLLLPQSTRALETTTLISEIRRQVSGVDVKIVDYQTRFEEYLRNGVPEAKNPVVIAGSMYLVGHLRSEMIAEERRLWARKES